MVLIILIYVLQQTIIVRPVSAQMSFKLLQPWKCATGSANTETV